MLLTTAYTAGAAGNDGVQPQVVPNLLQNSCAFRRPSNLSLTLNHFTHIPNQIYLDHVAITGKPRQGESK